MNSHSSYQSTNQNWIGDIPSHWTIKRLKYLTKVRKELSEHGTEELLSVTETRGIVKRKELRNVEENVSRSENLSGYRLVQKGDLVNNIMLVWKRGLGVSQYEGIVSPAYSVFSFNSDCDPNFFNYLLRTDEYISEFRRHSTGIVMSRLRLYDDSFGNVFAHLPPIEEQNLISRYLDKKTSQIDSLVDKIQKKIDLLKEQRTSLINHYVTKGLNPNVEMKDSNVDWIGDIPKHWIISKFKFVSTLYTGNSLNENQKLQYQSKNLDDIPYIASKDIDLDRQTINYNNGLRIPIKNNQLKIAPIGSFLMVVEGGSAGRKLAFLEEEVCFVNKLCAFYSTENTKFQYYFVQSQNYQNKFKSTISGLIGGVSISNLKNFELPLPPLSEQEEIVKYLEDKTRLIDQKVFFEEKRIELLKEYRQSLISELVTGKLMVTEDMI